MVIWAAIGGRTSIIGALAGALLVNFAKDKVSTAFPEFWLYLLGASFIIVVTLAPQGLAGIFSGLNLSPKPTAPKPKPTPAPADAPAQAAE
jgi:urea transport system permease protein